MDLEAVIDALAADGGLVRIERFPARPAVTATLRHPLPEAVASRGPSALWSHQATAIDLARAGRSVVVATGTASGKSACFQLPIAEAAAGDPPGTALCLFPTKALAHDQLRAFAELATPGLVPACYDGDTSPEERAWARRHASVLLTNPDMLHVGLLPHHARWSTFLMRLRYVVVDELHTLRGIFGSHVAHVLRRLRRLCAHYGSEPTFVFASATIGEPARLATDLCGLPVTPVLEDGSPHGERIVALWQPPVIDVASGARRSANRETAALLAALVGAGHRSIAFCRSRTGTELVAAAARRRAGADADSIRPYRGGYLREERRQVEEALHDGRLRGVVATSALELGVDIGTLDACVIDGFPGTIASFWQQAGRAGRSRQRSMAILVAGQDQLDQWLVAHPDELLHRPPEPAVVNPSNPFVLLPHLACAAYELPLSPADDAWWGDDLDDGVRRLVHDDRLRVRRGRGYWAGLGSPAWSVGLRTGSAGEHRIATLDGELVGTVDQARANESVHPGAVYLHQGAAWRVTRLDLDDGVSYVQPDGGGELTQARTESSVRIVADERRRSVGELELHLGAVEVTSKVVGYQRRDAQTGEVLGTEVLDLPASRFATRAFWYVVPPWLLGRAGLPATAWLGTLHAAEHAAIGMLPLFAICDRWDVGGLSTLDLAGTGAPTIVIYDGHPGGAGVAELGFDSGDRHLQSTFELLAACGCSHGCPSCVQSPKCGSWNEPLDKHGAMSLLLAALQPASTPTARAG